MSSLASYSGESDYGYSLTWSDEEALCAITDRLSPPKPPANKRSQQRTAAKPAKIPTAPPPVTTTTPAQRSYQPPPPGTSRRSLGQTFETAPAAPHTQFRSPSVDSDADREISAALASITDDDLSFVPSDLDTPERPKAKNPPAKNVANTSNKRAGSVVGRNFSRFSSAAAEVRDDVSVASRSSQARSKVLQTFADICYPDLTDALLEAEPNPLEDQTAGGTETSTPKPRRKIDDRSPIERFRNAPKRPLTVTDLTAGSWCELQFFYTLTRRGGKRASTVAMRQGTKVHEKLEREIFTPVEIRISNKEERMGLNVWNMIQGLRSLRDTGLTRELRVWGMVDGNVVSGIIDSVSYENPDPELEEDVISSRGGSQTSSQRLADLLPPGSSDRKVEIFITDVKTRQSPTKPSQAQVHASIIQLFLYHRFLSEMASDKLDYLRVFEAYGLDPDEPFSEAFISQLDDIPDISSISESTISNNHHFNSTMYSSDSEDSDSNYAPANQFTSLRSLVPLLKFEIQLTFPHGASDIGKIVAVEYRYRGKNPVYDDDSSEAALGNGTNAKEEEEEEDPQTGKVISVNTFYVEPHTLDYFLEETMGWWKGEREPRGVLLEEAFKCRSCEFADECEWRLRMDYEFQRKARTKRKQVGLTGKSPRKKSGGGEEGTQVMEEPSGVAVWEAGGGQDEVMGGTGDKLEDVSDDGFSEGEKQEKTRKSRKKRGVKKGKKKEGDGGDSSQEPILW
ncbi:exonuclease V [Cladorrhinum samala]|uniref:Exonuclease V n=1 Tax=Cladorrhinum samala TaxID=585594 RepID=A0AAV9HJH9_9PEZI|nr:exonuclease V [Cladorrhinum samala]